MYLKRRSGCFETRLSALFLYLLNGLQASMSTHYYLACDVGVESGRVVLGILSKGQLQLEEIHRFDTPTKPDDGDGQGPRWDLAELEKELFIGIAKAASRNLPISGLSANSGGSDYVLLDRHDRPLGAPLHNHHGSLGTDTARLLQKVPPAAIYAETGVPLLPLHTLFRLQADHENNPAAFQKAQRFLPIADYLNTRFSGVAACEESLASTTQLYNPQTHAWSPKLVAALDLPGAIMPRLVPSGTVFGPVVEELRRLGPLVNARVVATCSHDTAAAIAAVPARSEQRWAYLHSDSWSQFGVELPAPILSSQAREDDFTNEVGLGGSIRFLKNSVGLWMLEECRRSWRSVGQSYSDAELIQMARDSGPTDVHIYPNDPRFLEPGDMTEKIAAYCRETDQTVPSLPAEFVRIVLESLALAHAQTLGRLEGLIGQEIEVLHIVGRGSRNDLLNQLVADTTGLPVVTGPADAAAIGNILVQALALWHLKSPDHLRGIVSSSFPMQVLKPGPGFDKKTRDHFMQLGMAAVLA
jgi:rhamnulokinase